MYRFFSQKNFSKQLVDKKRNDTNHKGTREVTISTFWIHRLSKDNLEAYVRSQEMDKSKCEIP